jgi:hypothetical protein
VLEVATDEGIAEERMPVGVPGEVIPAVVVVEEGIAEGVAAEVPFGSRFPTAEFIAAATASTRSVVEGSPPKEAVADEDGVVAAC